MTSSNSYPPAEPLDQLPGLSSAHLNQLQQHGITTIQKLYTRTQTLNQRQQLAALLGDNRADGFKLVMSANAMKKLIISWQE